MNIRTILVALLVFVTAVALAAPTVEIISSKERTPLSTFDEDHLDLIVKEDGVIKDTHYFVSSYGKADAQLVRDHQGTYYVILRYGKGRGTHVRSEYITVFKVLKRLNQVVTFPLNGPAGMHSDWEYSYVLSKPKGGGLEFSLSLTIIGDDAIAYPEDKVRTISIK
jgi:hypothetical protein